MRLAHIIACVTFLAFSFIFQAHAQESPPAFHTSGLKLPRFVSLASDTVFVRTGPGMRYPIKWTLSRQGLPVEIVLEFENWRKIKDPDGQEGWVHQSLITGQRTALIKAGQAQTLRRHPQNGAQEMALVEPGAQVVVERCKQAWCRVNAHGYKGWIAAENLWGVYEGEEFD